MCNCDPGCQKFFLFSDLHLCSHCIICPHHLVHTALLEIPFIARRGCGAASTFLQVKGLHLPIWSCSSCVHPTKDVVSVSFQFL